MANTSAGMGEGGEGVDGGDEGGGIDEGGEPGDRCVGQGKGQLVTQSVSAGGVADGVEGVGEGDVEGEGGRPDDEGGVGDAGVVQEAGVGRREGQLDSSLSATVGVVDVMEGEGEGRGPDGGVETYGARDGGDTRRVGRSGGVWGTAQLAGGCGRGEGDGDEIGGECWSDDTGNASYAKYEQLDCTVTTGQRSAACEDFPDADREADHAEQSSVSSAAVGVGTGVKRRRVAIDEGDVNIAELNSSMTSRRPRGDARERALKKQATSSTMYSLDEWVIRKGRVVAEGKGGGEGVEMRATVVLDDNTRLRGLWGGGSKRKHSDLDGEVRVRRRPCRDNTE